MIDALPRSIPLEGGSNLRDLGGWPVAGGRVVRSGLVFRSASLAGLTDADVATLAGLGLRRVCDLRGEREAAAAPSRLPTACMRVPLAIEPQVGASLRDLARRESATGEDVVVLLRTAYLDYATTHLEHFRTLFDLLLDPDGPPLLIHCSAGKDRTGLAAALILLALGADRATIMADYVATDRLWKREFLLPAGTPQRLADALYATHPELLTAALDAAIARFGSEDAMFERGLGLDPDRWKALKARLTE